MVDIILLLVSLVLMVFGVRALLDISRTYRLLSNKLIIEEIVEGACNEYTELDNVLFIVDYELSKHRIRVGAAEKDMIDNAISKFHNKSESNFQKLNS